MPSIRRVATLSACASILALCFVSAVSAQAWSPSNVGLSGYDSTPAWQDEFNSAFDTSKWTPEDVAWPHNGELQYYSPNSKYVYTSNGNLNLVASTDDNGGRDYTSARIDTKKTMLFNKGVYAARIKSTRGQGIWPAFWLFGTGAKYSEIDIFESVGGNSATTTPPTGRGDDSTTGTLVHFAVEAGGDVTKGPNVAFHAESGKVLADDYHVYWIEWTGTELWAGMDGTKQKVLDDISKLDAFNAPMYIILNVAIGGGHPGNPDGTTSFPQTLSVDWVKVFAKSGTTVTIAPPKEACSAAVPDGMCTVDGQSCVNGECKASGGVPPTDANGNPTGSTPTTGGSTTTPTTGGSTTTPTTGGSTTTPTTGGSTDGGSTSGGSTSGGSTTPAPTMTAQCQVNNPTGSCAAGMTCASNGQCVMKSMDACSPSQPIGTCTSSTDTCNKDGKCVPKTSVAVTNNSLKNAASAASASTLLAVSLAMLAAVAAIAA